MARAVLTGFLVGGCLSAGGAAILSMLFELPTSPSVSIEAPESEAGQVSIAAVPGPVSTRRDDDPLQSKAPQVVRLERDAPVDLSHLADQSPRKPSTVATAPQVNALAGADQSLDKAPSADSPVAPKSVAEIPTAPQVEPPIKVSLDVQNPNVSTPEVASTADIPVAADQEPKPQVSRIRIVALGDTVGVENSPRLRELLIPDSPVVDESPAAPPEEKPIIVASIGPQQGVSPQTETQPSMLAHEDSAPEVKSPFLPAAGTFGAPEIDETLPQPPATKPIQSNPKPIVVASARTDGRVAIGRPATSLLNKSNPSQETVIEAQAQQPGAHTEPPLEQHSEPFEDSLKRPMLSIVLMDTGQDIEAEAVSLQALQDFPYALSFAVDASLPDAAERAAKYRTLGLEVLALVDLPQELNAQDTEVAMSVALEAVPDAVAVMEGPATGLQGNKQISDQVSAILKDSGHGIVWRPNGLDTASKLAARDGLPSRTMFRDFDSKGQTPKVIRRFLDQAAFKARQHGAVIMVGRVRADTISALLVWGLQDRASKVGIAPISAVLRGKESSS